MKTDFSSYPQSVHRDDDETVAFRRSVEAGLSRGQKTLEAKYFYDAAGSDLFDEICKLDDYYPTRTETRILTAHMAELRDIVGPGAEIVELGSGASLKTRHLLAGLERPARYVPIDISASYLDNAAAHLRPDFPALDIAPLEADFSWELSLPEPPAKARRLLFFPGSTIGNLHRREAEIFMARMHGETGADYFLVGVDLKKDKATLERAYDDSEGVTAAFNLNLLKRINRELDGAFDVAKFTHMARYNEDLGRIEMHLVSTVAQRVRIGNFVAEFFEGETIHTENSYKYTPGDFAALAARAGWTSHRIWLDERALFSLHLLKA